ncbi:inositol monophosphatase family protein [Nocardioides pocheonensis]|uniref:Inositol monophosphatase family protein n=1 Tax=Nocardioides pocheonensis TaxID=661485 RepID=A0A3N0GM67_9ACTN|nr:inositol monophosphatase family protein [Nocardioides pocheonensis]RNM13272.1 inositol monophosphatase family protein [Nocardioides pocheonensis]
MTDLADDAALAADVVREAGLLAQELREAGLRVHTKTNVSDVVTAADHAAERLVLDHLATWRPDDGVLGEEGAERPSASGRTWVIDPVDGTYNFVHGFGWWCSAIALVVDGDPVLGAVYHPHDDVLYVGGPDLPTTRNGEPVGPLADVELALACATTYLHPPFFDGEVGEAFARAVGGAATLRMLGSASLDLAAVAQGQVGVFVQHSVAPWDWYPSSALVRGAGGTARRITAAGVEWSVAGAPTAVAEVCAALTEVRA